MLKQWKSKNKNVNYICVPDKKGDKGETLVLTSDNILMSYDEFQNITEAEYKNKYVGDPSLKTMYSYTKTKELGKLSLSKESSSISLDSFLESPLEENIIEKPLVEVEEKIITNPKMVITKVKSNKTRKKKLFDFNKIIINTERFIMLLISMFTITLSIYYTFQYLSKTNPPIIALFLSISMLLFSLIGVQLVGFFWKKRSYIIAILLNVTSVTTILFSMFTSLDVNMSTYLENSKVVETSIAENSTDTLLLENIRNQIEENRRQVEILNEDMTYYASRGLNTFTQRESIAELNNKYEELNKQEIDILIGNNDVALQETTKNREMLTASSLVEVVSRTFGINKDTFQMIIMLFASVFIDVLSPLALHIFIYGNRSKNIIKKKEK